MEWVAAIVLATAVLPFLIGWWIGNPVFAAAAWGGLGLTLVIQQLTRGNGAEGEAVLGLVLGCGISAAAAAYGGHVREKRTNRDR
ncbi:MAG TPA: hypothetical protein VD790_06715 [Thermoleophilaceae bacterium]|nr:hypothetical protein [Thermoleophilaceae bacterium]